MTAADPSPSLGRGEVTSTDALRHLALAARPHLTTAAAVAAATLAVSSSGSMVVAAVLLGIVVRDRVCGLALVGAVAAVSVRFATASFDDVAGIQSVLGAAGLVGPATGAASAWLAASAVVLAVGRRSGGIERLTVSLAGGALAAAIVAGPGPGGGLAVRVGATVAAVLVTLALQRADRWRAVSRVRPWLALVLAVAAVVSAVWP